MKNTELNELWAKVDGGNSAAVTEQLRLSTDLSEQEYCLRAIARYNLRDWRGSLQDANVVLEKNRDNLMMRGWRGLCLGRLGRFGESCADLVEAPFFPHHLILFEYLRLFWPLQFEAGGPGIRSSESEDFEARVEKVSKSDPLASSWQKFKSSGAEKNGGLRKKYEKQAYKFHNKREYDLAWLSCLRSAECDPEHEKSVLQKAQGLLGFHQVEEACALVSEKMVAQMEAYQEKKDEDLLPEGEYVCMWAMLLHYCGDYEGSLAVVGELTPSGPYDYGMHFIAGVNWIMLDDREKAWKCLEIGFRDFYFETWPLYLEEFKKGVDSWLKEKAAED